MSTFDGFIREFPEIRADYFRPLENRPPALAYFLSHIHSDHLAGLETFKSPFIYCSPATREMLLRLKKYLSRMNYVEGILENPHTQTYKHLAKVLKPIPLDTPTVLELRPGHNIQVTLLDANHCIGSVMFLFEGHGKAVLYTGDIRCEPLFVSNITRNPSMIEYSTGLKALDCIYIDTSVLDDIPLQTKAEGLAELLRKVSKYPPDTIFHFHAWTFGYEDVWVALSKALNSKIHVDKYKWDLYKSLVTKPTDQRFASQTHLAKEAPYLAGFTCGNTQYKGCLTLDENVRIHSCEKGMGCSVTPNKPIVWIRPIVTHLKSGQDVVEVGIGGGGGDLTEQTSLMVEDIMELLKLVHASKTIPEGHRKEMELMFTKALLRNQDLNLDIDATAASDEITIAKIIKALVDKIRTINSRVMNPEQPSGEHTSLPNIIQFPWARHSYLPELRQFISAFKPKDVWPCTVDISWIEKGYTIRSLFGDLCSGDTFEYDKILRQTIKAQASLLEQDQGHGDGEDTDSQQTRATSIPPLPSSPIVSHALPTEHSHTNGNEHRPKANPTTRPLPLQPTNQAGETALAPPSQQKRGYDIFIADRYNNTENSNDDDCANDDDHAGEEEEEEEEDHLEGDDDDDSQASALSAPSYETRRRAFRAALANASGDPDAWVPIGLISTTDHHSFVDEEL
ncbi:beta-lactamase-like protein [Biscogniauxia mediterranea]|nr:beta-lactamase-like protein [Biscogniauxia mediterranea]